MENVIIVFILLAIAAAIIWYLAGAKKRGETCIGCPYAKQCGAKCGGCNCLGTDTHSDTCNII